MAIYCPRCNAPNADTAQVCYACQTPLAGSSGSGYQPMQQAYSGGPPAQQIPGAEKKLVAGLCGILVGGFGVHKFILGYTTEGIIQIAITFLTCGIGSVIGLVEGIIYLTKSDEEFVRTYIQNKKGWF